MKEAKTRLLVEGLGVLYAIEKLRRAEIFLYSVKKIKKNTISFAVESKDCKKVFAILQSPCYNVKEVKYLGLSRLLHGARRYAGLIAGILFGCLLVAGLQSRILSIDVTGSGACYRAEVINLLSENGITRFGVLKKDTALCTSQILALPRVSYCALEKEGGVLTVRIEVNDEEAPHSGEPLKAPAAGVVEELFVLRGTALVQVGEEVCAGDTLVKNVARCGEKERPVLVIARVKIRYCVEEYFPGSEEEARAGALLKYGEIQSIRLVKKEGGYLVTGTAYIERSMNLV